MEKFGSGKKKHFARRKNDGNENVKGEKERRYFQLRKNKGLKNYSKHSKNKIDTYENSVNYDFEDDVNDYPKWFDEFPDDTKIVVENSAEEIEGYRKKAELAWKSEVEIYHNRKTKGRGNSDYQWRKTVLAHGTFNDKIAANVLNIQDSPIHNVDCLMNLIGMVKAGSKECPNTIEALLELFSTDLLPKNRKLRSFESCPFSLLDSMSSGKKNSRNHILALWFFENRLKKIYYEFVTSLSMVAKDGVDSIKERAIRAMSKLLEGHPEQEGVLLANIVNKLGDPSPKLSAKTMYCLFQILKVHKNMQAVMLKEIEKFLFRHNVTSRSQFYGVCFLAQFYFSKEDATLANNIIKVYISFFISCTQKGDVDSRLMKVLITGIHRAYPFADMKENVVLEQIGKLYKIAHISSLNIAVPTLNLLFQIIQKSDKEIDRFYTALYEKIWDPFLSVYRNPALFISLIYRALKTDKNRDRIKAFVKRLLQVCCQLPIPLVCGILFLLSKVLYSKNRLLSIVLNREDFDDQGAEENYIDIKMEDANFKEEAVTSNEDKFGSEEDVKPNVKSFQSWQHCDTSSGSYLNSKIYDPFKRNPVYSGVKYSAYRELLKLSNHFHPSISLYASNILKGEQIIYNGDPLKDFTLSSFLDRFVFKNPKKLSSNDIQNTVFSRRQNYTPSGMKALRIDSKEYLDKEESRVPVDELFIYKFLQHRNISREDKDDVDDDADSVASDEFEGILKKFMKANNNGVDIDDDLDFAEDFTKNPPPVSKKEAKRKEIERDEEEDVDDEEDIDDEEGSISDFGDGEDEKYVDDDDDNDYSIDDDDLDDDDAEDLDFDDDGGSDIDADEIANYMSNMQSTKKRKSNHSNKEEPRNKKIKKNESKNFRDTLASAEEFAEILEDAGSSRVKAGSWNAVSNWDNSGEKQLRWEESKYFSKNDHRPPGGQFRRNHKPSYGKPNKFSGKPNKGKGLKRKNDRKKNNNKSSKKWKGKKSKQK